MSECLSDQWIPFECGSSAHFYYVRCHGLQWDESRLLHVDLLLISNYPWEILKRQIHKCETNGTTTVIMCVGKAPSGGYFYSLVLFSQ